MLTETGKVVALEVDGLWVETLKKSSCAQCSARHGCGQKLLAKHSLSSDMTFIKVPFDDNSQRLDWQVGDLALLGVEENALASAALIAYGLPLIAMLIGIITGGNFAPGDGFAFAGGILGLFVGALLVKLHARVRSENAGYQARVLEKCSEAVIVSP